MGILWIAATPIGNLGDITSRALQHLSSASIIVAEDTRMAKILLTHININAKIISFHNYSSTNSLPKLFENPKDDIDIVYITDAGTPNVSDPGRELCAYAIANGFKVLPLPGPSAITAALSICPFADRGFVFLGFLPRKGIDRHNELQTILTSRLLSVIFESPNRAHGTIDELAKILEPTRRIFVAREMTKIHEQYTLFTIDEWLSNKPEILDRGEFTIIIDHSSAEPEPLITADQLASAMVKSGITGRNGLNFLKHFPPEILHSIRKRIYNKDTEND